MFSSLIQSGNKEAADNHRFPIRRAFREVEKIQLPLGPDQKCCPNESLQRIAERQLFH